MVALFAAASFVTAALLFVVQPMVGKMVLPLFGGTASVWNTAMVFFQAALLLGYGYSHVTTRRLGVRRQVPLHLALLLLPLLALPIAIPADGALARADRPALALLALLTITVGAPFAVVSTSGPLLQRWFSATGHRNAQDPYFLYAAGNTGSLLALLGYPFVIERVLDVPSQSRLWTGGYALAVALLVSAGIVTYRRAPRVATTTEARPPALPLRRKVRWAWLAFLPSSAFLGTTTFISTDVAAVPLLWVLPLAVYLMTFIVAFGTRSQSTTSMARRLLPVFVTVVAIVTARGGVPISIGIGLHLALLLVLGLAAHGTVAADRPPPQYLTGYFLLLSVGGVAGGLFTALVAPLLFDGVAEYSLVLVAALLTVTADGVPVGLRERLGTSRGLLVLVAAAVVVLGVGAWATTSGRVALVVATLVGTAIASSPLGRRRITSMGAIGLLLFAYLKTVDAAITERTFFGVYRVALSDEGTRLFSGTTLHGAQAADPELAEVPATYYHPTGVMGEAIREAGDWRRLGVIGLGAGALAMYGDPGDEVVFHEIDPLVIDIAEDPELFTYLRDADAEVTSILGDGRLTLVDLEQPYDLIVLDAFASDAIPVHLLTVEALDVYLDALVPDGLLIAHISNRHLDLAPVVAGLAQARGLAGVVGFSVAAEDDPWVSPTQVAVLGPRDRLAVLAARERWAWLDEDVDEPIVWTDQRSDLLAVLR